MTDKAAETENGRAGERPAGGRWLRVLGGITKLILLLLALPALAIAWLAFAPNLDPEVFAEQALPNPVAQRSEGYAGEGCAEDRLCRDVTLTLSREAPLRFAVSLPAAHDGEPLPVIILFGGFRTGREALQHLPALGRNAVITYEYPVDRHRWQAASLAEKAWLLRGGALAVPRQIAALVDWTRDQGWADRRRVSLVGVSLGALLLPAAQRLASARGARLGPAVLVYGGAEPARIVAANLDLEPPWLLRAVAWLGALVARPIEAGHHLSRLEGAFLLINGREDWRIPMESAERLHALAPEPKKIVLLEAGHIDPKDKALLIQILAVVRDWLTAQGAVNP